MLFPITGHAALSRLPGSTHRAALSAARFHSSVIRRDGGGLAIDGRHRDRLAESIPLKGPRSLRAFSPTFSCCRPCRPDNSVGTIHPGRSAWSSWPIWRFRLRYRRIARAPHAVKLVLGASFLPCSRGLRPSQKGDLDQWDGPITLLRCMPEFLVGTLLYFAFRDHGDRFG